MKICYLSHWHSDLVHVDCSKSSWTFSRGRMHIGIVRPYWSTTARIPWTEKLLFKWRRRKAIGRITFLLCHITGKSQPWRTLLIHLFVLIFKLLSRVRSKWLHPVNFLDDSFFFQYMYYLLKEHFEWLDPIALVFFQLGRSGYFS